MRTRKAAAQWAFCALSSLILAACATKSGDARLSGSGDVDGLPKAWNRPYAVRGRTYVPAAQPGYDVVGVASWYGYESGRRTADGEVFSLTGLTAAHPTLPIPGLLEITNLENGRRVRVRLNDRGPFSPGRLVDVSREAARELGFLEKGSARVRVRWLGGAELRVAVAPPSAQEIAALDLVADLPPSPSGPRD